MRKAVAGQDAVVSLAARIPCGADTIKPRPWKQDDRIRTGGGGIGVVLRLGLLFGPDRSSGGIPARARAGKAVVPGKPTGVCPSMHALGVWRG
jgi:hypothetical protein